MSINPPNVPPFTRPMRPVTNITPFTYRDGHTFLEILEAFRGYINQMVPEMQAIFDVWHERYTQEYAALVDDVNTAKDLWEQFYNDFRADMVEQIAILNDEAVAGLLDRESSVLRDKLHSIFATHETMATFETDMGDQFNTFKGEVNTRVDGLDTSLGETITRVTNNESQISDNRNRFSSTGRTYAHTHFGITGGDPEQVSNAINTLSQGETLSLPEDLSFDATTKAVEINVPGVRLTGGTFTGRGNLMKVTADGVCVENVRFIGGGNREQDHDAGANVLEFSGNVDQYIDGVCIKNVHIRDIGYTGIRLAYVTNFLVEDCSVIRFRYAGISVWSGKHGHITRNEVHFAESNASVSHNSYGIVASQSKNVEASHVCENITVSHNNISHIYHWEALDTHAGKNIWFLYNRMWACRRAISLGSSRTEPNSGPIDCLVIGNWIDCAGSKTDVIPGTVGITMAGDADRVTKPNAIIAHNTILNAEQPVIFHWKTPGRYNYRKCFVGHNVSNTANPDGTMFDTGWMSSGYEEFVVPHASASPLSRFAVRIVNDGTMTRTYIRGGMTRSDSGQTELMRFTVPFSPHLPPETHDIYGVTGINNHPVGAAYTVPAGGNGKVYPVMMGSDRRVYVDTSIGNVSIYLDLEIIGA